MQTARRYRTVHIHAGGRPLTAADPIPDELRDAITAIIQPKDARQFDQVGFKHRLRRFKTCAMARELAQEARSSKLWITPSQ